jgi:predicted metal-dependent phosphoesterase TrpH
MKADLHTHSRCSDGSLTVEELVDHAHECGITHLSITDHDTTEGLARAEKRCEEYGISFIRGIEISAIDIGTKRKVHILGFGFSSESENIKAICEPLLKRRHQNTLRQLRILQDAGYPVSDTELEQEAGDSRIFYKQHIMSVLVKKGITGQIYSNLYKELFKGNGIAAGDIHYVSVIDAVRAIHLDGGIPVLAHPGQQSSFHVIRPLLKHGLRGIEVNHPDHSARHKTKIRELAREFNLLLTGGSDFHGSYGSPCELGEITAPNSFSSIFQEVTA